MKKGVVKFEIYAYGAEDYMGSLTTYFKIFYLALAGACLSLLLSQKCRSVDSIHNQEIEEYRQRKFLFKEFETDELFRKHA